MSDLRNEELELLRKQNEELKDNIYYLVGQICMHKTIEKNSKIQKFCDSLSEIVKEPSSTICVGYIDKDGDIHTNFFGDSTEKIVKITSSLQKEAYVLLTLKAIGGGADD